MKNQILAIYFLFVLIPIRVSSQDSPGRRYGHTATLIDSKLYIIGGVQSFQSIPLNEILMLDLSTPLNTTSPPWQNIKAMGALQTAWGTACAVGDKIYLFGGNTLMNNNQQSVSLIFKLKFK